MLKYYDSKKLYLEVDASKRVVGMVLLQSVQNDHESKDNDGVQESCVGTQPEKCIILDNLLPVAYGSKTLTDTESCYANIEWELLGVVSGIEKFYTFCYSWSTIILSDHKPMTSIVKKDLVNAPPRLQ